MRCLRTKFMRLIQLMPIGANLATGLIYAGLLA
jgi:hypothetical protein